ncbi:MAG: hypothetical protein ACRDRH_20250 [Pseudonocardia sp.]
MIHPEAARFSQVVGLVLAAAGAVGYLMSSIRRSNHHQQGANT